MKKVLKLLCGDVHGFLFELGRITKTSGPHYHVEVRKSSVVIIDSKCRVVSVSVRGYDLIIKLPNDVTVIAKDYFSDKPASAVIKDGCGEEYDAIHVPGLGTLTATDIINEVMKAVGKYFVYRAVE